MPYRLNYFLFQIIGFFIFFGAIIGKSIFAPAAILRVLAFSALFVICLIHRKKLRCFPKTISKYSAITFYLFFVLIGFFSLDALIDSENEGGRIYRQYFFFLVFIYEFVNFTKLTGKPISDFLHFLVKIAVTWVIINTLLYFVELPIWENFRNWPGRISNGYPTVDVICLCFALIIVLFVEKLGTSKWKRLICTFIIIAGIISQFSGTGTVALITILITFSIVTLISNDLSGDLKQNFFLSIFAFILFVMTGFGYFYTKEPELTETALSLITKKAEYFIGDEYELPEWGTKQWGDTAEMREEQFASNMKRLRSVADHLLGIGFNDVTMDNGGASKRNGVFIEDQYSLNYISIGYIGSILFLIFVCAPVVDWMKFNLTRRCFAGAAFGALCTLVFLFSCRTLITMASAQVEMAYGFFYAVLLRPEEVNDIGFVSK